MIGIIGAYGNIGIEAAEIIKENIKEKIRIAGRDFSKASQRAKEMFKNDEWFQIKESSIDEWKAFIRNCRIVLCSAELDNRTIENVNLIASDMNCPVVYLGINVPEKEIKNGKYIYGAGSIPGLSGILPQYLAQEFDSVVSIDFYYGARGSFTYTSAKDYMEGIFSNNNRSMVMWKSGRIIPYSPSITADVNIYIQNETRMMKCFPYFDDESEYLCNKYSISEGRWHMCISGEQTLKVLERARYDYQSDPNRTLQRICRASKLDCFGTISTTKLICSMKGIIANRVVEKLLVLSCNNPSKLTGSVAAATVLTIMESKIDNGSSFLSRSKINLKVLQKLLFINPEIKMRIRNNMENDEIEGEV